MGDVTQPRPWSAAEEADCLALDYAEFAARYPDRTYDGWRLKRGRLRRAGEAPQPKPRPQPVPEVTNIVGVRAGEPVDIEDAIDRARRQYKRVNKTHERKHQQHIYLTGAPMMLALFSDQHIGSPHTDIDRMFAEQDLVLATPGAYVALAGDIVDNYVIGKLTAVNMHHTVTVAEEWAIAKHYLERFGDRLLWVHSGNHPAWSNRLIGLDIDRTITPDGVLYDADEILVNVHIGAHSYLVRSRHKWQGSSMYNPTHAMERAARFDNAAPDIFIGGHVHKGAMIREFVLAGERKTAILVGTYKGSHDTYAREVGFPANDASTGAAVIFFPDGSYQGFGSISAACQVMRAIYRRAA